MTRDENNTTVVLSLGCWEDLTVRTVPVILKELEIDGLAQEMDRTIAKQKITGTVRAVRSCQHPKRNAANPAEPVNPYFYRSHVTNPFSFNRKRQKTLCFRSRKLSRVRG